MAKNREDADSVFYGDSSDFSSSGRRGTNVESDSVETESKRKYDSFGGETKLQHETANLKCPDCGGNYKFDAETGGMKCVNCNSVQSIERDKWFDANDFDPDLDVRVLWEKETRVFKCSNCGAQTVFDSTEFASECAFCGSPNIVTLNDFDGIKPDIVMPFSVTQERVSEIIKRWVKRRIFAPSKFRREYMYSKTMNGVYCPCWLFDACTDSTYRARAGTYYYVTVGSGKDQRTERRISWRRVSGDYFEDFSNVVVESSPHLSQKQANKLKPFPNHLFVSYDKRFLMGYKADHYDTGLKDSWLIARGIIDKAIERGVKAQINADVVENLVVRTRYSNKQYKYALVPVYIGSFKHKNKDYKFYVNGATGKYCGKIPTSGWKVFALVAGIVGLHILGLLFAWLLDGGSGGSDVNNWALINILLGKYF